MAETTKLLQQALALHHAGDVGAAAQLYQKILTLDPYHADAYQLLAVIARQMGNHTLAQSLLEQAITLHPQHVTALSNLALLLREQGDIVAAALHARAAVAADPQAAEARIALGGVLVAQRDYAAALEQYHLARGIQPENILLLNDSANAERRLGHHAKAYATINRAIALESQLRKDAHLLAMLHHTRQIWPWPIIKPLCNLTQPCGQRVIMLQCVICCSVIFRMVGCFMLGGVLLSRVMPLYPHGMASQRIKC